MHRAFFPNVRESHDVAGRSGLLKARDETDMVVGSGALLADYGVNEYPKSPI
jgi:hypothetical protein